jgi:hypothetical protein
MSSNAPFVPSGRQRPGPFLVRAATKLLAIELSKWLASRRQLLCHIALPHQLSSRDREMEPKGFPMTRETRTRVLIAVLIYSMVSSVLFGAGLIFVLTLPVLSADAGFWISVVVGASFILAAPIAWWIAPRLRARYGRRRITANHAPLS